MEKQVPSKKERKGAQGSRKVKTGCLTCKIRHKKCDERKPACSQCTSTGRKCDTSPSFPFWRVPMGQTGMLGGPHDSPVWGITTLDPLDVWNFEYFRVVCAKELSLFLRTDLWEVLILRGASTERYILDGVVAVAAFSRNMWPSKTSNKVNFIPGYPVGFSLHKYTLAAQEMRKQLTTASLRTPECAIAGCLVFLAFELMQNRPDVARLHLRGALSILESFGGSIGDPKIRREITHALLTLSKMDGPFLGYARHHDSTAFPSLPTAFNSIHEARNSLNFINGAIISILRHDVVVSQLLTRAPPPHLASAADVSRLSGLLESWERLFTSFLSTDEGNSAASICALILRIQYHLVYVTTSTYLHSNETAYDLYMSHFASIVNLATELLRAINAGFVTTNETPDPRFTVAVALPVFFVACKCRNTGLRRQALEILDVARVGGFYDTQLLAKASRWVMHLEDGNSQGKGSFGLTPERDRLHNLSVDVDAMSGICRCSAWRKGENGQWLGVSQLVRIDSTS